MSPLRIACWLCLGAGVLLVPRVAECQTPHDAFEPVTSLRAVVVVVADAGGPALEALLRELLRRRGIEPTFVEQPAFDREQLLENHGPNTAPNDPVWVFVVARSNRAARLYFRAPGADRFLLRDVALRDGLDELGRELVGQVVESGVDALLNEGAGMTRAEVRAALEREAPEPKPRAKSRAPLAGPTAPPPAMRPVEPTRAPSSIAGWLAARYDAAWTGAALGLAHGPGLELGMGLGRRVVARARLVGALHWPEQLDTPEIQAHLVTSTWRAAADLGMASGSKAVFVSVGAGQDFTRVDPRAKAGAHVTAASPTRTEAVVARLELRVEAGGSRLRLAVIGFADVGLSDTHYDVSEPAGVRRVAEIWPVEPGLGVALGCRL